jgi:hypothetical protein
VLLRMMSPNSLNYLRQMTRHYWLLKMRHYLPLNLLLGLQPVGLQPLLPD